MSGALSAASNEPLKYETSAGQYDWGSYERFLSPLEKRSSRILGNGSSLVKQGTPGMAFKWNIQGHDERWKNDSFDNGYTT
jgi:hypothetical protein